MKIAVAYYLTPLLFLLRQGGSLAFHPPASSSTRSFSTRSGRRTKTQGNHRHRHHQPSSLVRCATTNKDENSFGDFVDLQRRNVWKKTAVQMASVVTAGTALAVLTRPAWAAQKSRTAGYTVQKTEKEWKSILSPIQYNILRQGGTERPGFSILEKEKRPGVFRCAGCDTPLFATADKFNSKTGWPSFARSIGSNVEIEALNPMAASFSGAELRCQTCGGHLGDVFNDGFLFVGTEAAVTGKRYCIDGAALVFYPEGDGGSDPVRGDQSANNKPVIPSFLEPPKVTPRDE